MNSPITLPTEKQPISLRQLTLQDASAYFESIDANREHLSQFNDETANKYPDLQSVVYSIEEPANPDKLRMGIWDEDTFVGSVNLTPHKDGSAEIGYWIDGRYLRRGYATLAAKAISSYATEHFSSVLAEVTEGNDPSASVLKKAGFRQIGREGTNLIFKLMDFPLSEHTQLSHIREPRIEDLESLSPILATWIRSRADGAIIQDEVEEVIDGIHKSVQDLNDRQYVVAENKAGRVVGVMGMRIPDEAMLTYATTTFPIEIINAYVDPTEVEQGVGSAMLTTLEQMAREQGYEEIVINSGPRNKHSGWEFWTKRCGKPVAVAEESYGNGAEAVIWRKLLVDSK